MTLADLPAPQTPWDAGWHRDAVRQPSPNFGPRPDGAAIDLIVVHSISLPPGHYGSAAVQQLFANTLDWDAHPYFQSIRGLQVSSHFFIERDGTLWQFVDCDQRAWHAGQSCYVDAPNAMTTRLASSWRGSKGRHSSRCNTRG
jgi:AmpD protein